MKAWLALGLLLVAFVCQASGQYYSFPLRFPLEFSTLTFQQQRPDFSLEAVTPDGASTNIYSISVDWAFAELLLPSSEVGYGGTEDTDVTLVRFRDIVWDLAIGPDALDPIRGTQIVFTSRPPAVVNYTTGNETVIITYHIFNQTGRTYIFDDRYLSGDGLCNVVVPAPAFLVTVQYNGYKNFTRDRHIRTILRNTYPFDAADARATTIRSTSDVKQCTQSSFTWNISNPFGQTGSNVTDLVFQITSPEIDSVSQNTFLEHESTSQRTASLTMDQSDPILHGITFYLYRMYDPDVEVTSWKDTVMWILIVVILVVGGICSVFICLINWLDQKVQQADRRLDRHRAKLRELKAAQDEESTGI